MPRATLDLFFKGAAEPDRRPIEKVARALAEAGAVRQLTIRPAERRGREWVVPVEGSQRDLTTLAEAINQGGKKR